MSEMFGSSDFEKAFQSFLAQRVELKDEGKFLVETACMDPETRTIYGYLEAFLVYRNLKGTGSNLEKFKKPLKTMGRAKWGRGVMDDLALFVGLGEGQGINLFKS
jgi:hypothetical protein